MLVFPRIIALSNFAMGTILGKGFPQAQVRKVHTTSAKRLFQSQDRSGSTAGLGGLHGGLEGAGNDSTSAVASNTTKLQTKV